MMRICFLADAPSIHTQRWVSYFVRRGHEAHLVSFRSHEIEGSTLHLVKRKTTLEDLDYLLNLSRVKAIVRKIGPDLLNSHYLTSYGYLGARTKFHPFVASAWGSDVLVAPRKTPLHRLLTSTVLKSADLITCESQILATRMAQLGAAKENILVVPQGVDPTVFFPAQEAERKNIILSVRDLKPVYNIDVIIKAAQRLQEMGADFKLVVAGNGLLRTRLEVLAKELGLSRRVDFTSRLTHSHIAALHQQSKVFISIPSSDSTSTALLEAMATGNFPIVSDIPANKEWIEDHVNGLLVPPRNPLALANAMAEALGNDKLRGKAAEINLKAVRERALWENNMEIVEKRFLDLFERARARR